MPIWSTEFGFQSRPANALGLSLASKQPIPETRFGVFRM